MAIIASSILLNARLRWAAMASVEQLVSIILTRLEGRGVYMLVVFYVVGGDNEI